MNDMAPRWVRRTIWWLRGGWTNWRWTDRLPDKVLDATDRLNPLVDRLAKVVCHRFGHIPTVDYCGMPEHDYCDGCNKAMPGLADRTGIKERWEKYRPGTPCPYVFNGERWVTRPKEST